MRRIVIPMLGVLVGLMLAACGNDTSAGYQASTAAVSAERAQAVAQNMLVAYNSGDYQAFSRDLASPVKAVVSEHAFREFRDDNLPATGPFTAIIRVTPTAGQQGAAHANYEVYASFEKRDGVVFTMTLSSDGAKIEGLEFEPQP